MKLRWWVQDRRDDLAIRIFGQMTMQEWKHYRTERMPWTSR